MSREEIDQAVLDDLAENPSGLEFHTLRDRLGLGVTAVVLESLRGRGLIECVPVHRGYWDALVWRIPAEAHDA